MNRKKYIRKVNNERTNMNKLGAILKLKHRVVILPLFFICFTFMFSMNADAKISDFENAEAGVNELLDGNISTIQEDTETYSNTYTSDTGIMIEITSETDILNMISMEDLYYLAECVEIEAEGEGLTGKLAVANIVNNRVNDSSFPKTYKEVVSQKYRGIQFTSYITKDWGKKEITEETFEAIREMLMGENNVGERTFFSNLKKIKSGWFYDSIKDGTLYDRIDIGNHSFFSAKK